MSTYNRSLAFEEIRESKDHLVVDLIPMRHLSISNASADIQQPNQVVKISGNITVSF